MNQHSHNCDFKTLTTGYKETWFCAVMFIKGKPSNMQHEEDASFNQPLNAVMQSPPCTYRFSVAKINPVPKYFANDICHWLSSIVDANDSQYYSSHHTLEQPHNDNYVFAKVNSKCTVPNDYAVSKSFIGCKELKIGHLLNMQHYWNQKLFQSKTSEQTKLHVNMGSLLS